MEKSQLYAFYATLAAICYLATIVAGLAFISRYTEALGFGGIIVGLIGVIKLPSTRTVTIDNTPAQPVPVDPS